MIVKAIQRQRERNANAAMNRKKKAGPRMGWAIWMAWKSKSPSAIENSDSIVLTKLE